MGTRRKQDTAADVWRTMARFTLDVLQGGDHLAVLREHGLTPGHLKALSTLDPDEPRSMGAMADLLQCDASQITFLVDRLEERGFVERRTLPSDRRVKTIVLTPAGLRFRAKVLEQVYRPPASLLALPVASLEALRAQLDQLPAPSGGFWNGDTPRRA